MKLSSTFFEHFEDLPDPRKQNQHLKHKLMDIIIITVLGTICGANRMVEVCEYAEANITWLKGFLELEHGIPSHDTFERVFSRLNPIMFEERFRNWTSSLSLLPDGSLKNVIAIDGKTSRGSKCVKQNIKPIHTVSAWACSQKLMLGQIKTEEKSNEITAIPKLLEMVNIKDSVVTIDAMGCQTKIQNKIIEAGGDYVINVKNNQKTLAKEVKALFAYADTIKYKKIFNRHMLEKDVDHGRVDKRRYSLLALKDCPEFSLRWPGLKSIGRIELKSIEEHVVTTSTRYFVTSLQYDEIKDFMNSARKHWDIEINLHWSLDVSFREDENKMRKGFSSENVGMIRRIALNLLKQEKTHKRGIECKRKRAGWDKDYLWRVLTSDRHLTESMI